MLISLAGGYLVYYNTNLGPWAFSDSTVYIAAGINWVKGGGMGFTQADGDFARLTHYPPGYPVLIGLTSLVTASPLEAARWINIVCFSLLIFLGGWLIWRITASRLFAILFGVLILTSPFLLNTLQRRHVRILCHPNGYPGAVVSGVLCQNWPSAPPGVGRVAFSRSCLHPLSTGFRVDQWLHIPALNNT